MHRIYFTVICLVASCGSLILAQPPPATSRKFAPPIVSKAEQILQRAGLWQTGQAIQSTETTPLLRALAGLGRERRELRLLYKQWESTAEHIHRLRREVQSSNADYLKLNLQLTQIPASEAVAHNRVVGLVDVAAAKIQALERELERQHQILDDRRGELNEAESEYADQVRAIRDELNAVLMRLREAMSDPNVEIALHVMHTNYDTPEAITAHHVLDALDKRILRIEQEVHRETIPLQADDGCLWVDVSIEGKPIAMVVDRGAPLLILTRPIAMRLGITVPAEAREMRLVLADGRTINAKSIVLSNVRVGEFGAENVAAAILESNDPALKPVLGMSYLGQFQFDVQTAEQTLQMLRVNTH